MDPEPDPEIQAACLREVRLESESCVERRALAMRRMGCLVPAAFLPADAPSASEVSEVDRDADRLLELGYRQELRRRLGGLDNVAMGFATISPVVGLYAVVGVGIAVAGPAWIWVLPVALAGQCLLLAVYSELSAEFPLTGGPYQWSRRLLGGAYGWFNGWVAICAYAVANTTIAYLGAPWALGLLGIAPTAEAIVITGMVLVLVCAVVGARGIDVLKRAVRAGIAAEVLALVGIGAALLLAFREQELSILTETLGAEELSGGSVGAALLAALAVGGWVFIGFDACVGSAEETKAAARHVPRAVWISLLSVAALVILNSVATALAHPDPGAVVAGRDVEPVTTAVVGSFGSWSTKPFAALVLIAFLACGTAAQAMTARGMYSIARDGVLPASGFLRRVDRRGTPIGGVVATILVACLGLLLGLESAAIGSLIVFGTAGTYVSFLLIALAALVARTRGTWRPGAHIRLGRVGTVANALAVAWLAFETVNIAWPRASLAPEGAPFYQVWAAPLVLALIGVTGLVYLLVARPHEKLEPRARTAGASAGA
jgi:amino acid transporter